MRTVAISLIILAGAMMASAGTIANAMPGQRQVSYMDTWGLVLIAIGLVIFVLDRWGHLFNLPDEEKI